MLRQRERIKLRKQNRYYERLSLEQQAPNERIPPYKYFRPSTEPLGINPTATTEYDTNRSTIDINTTTYYNSNENDTSDDSISLYTIRLYNRLEGRWENRRPITSHQTDELEKYEQEEEERLSTEPHPIHNWSKRAFYVEYHRQRIYTNDTDSSYIESDTSLTNSDTTDNNYNSTDTSTSNTSDSSSITCHEDPLRYYPDHDYNAGRRILFEFDSTGDFPQPYSTSSTTTSSISTTPDYNTQEEIDNDYYTTQGNRTYTQNHPSDSDYELEGYEEFKPVRHTITNTPPTRHSTPSNTLPTFSGRKNLPLLAARKSVPQNNNPLPYFGARNRSHPLLAARKSTPILPDYTYSHISSTKQTARKLVKREHTVLQTVAFVPDTTTSATHPTTTNYTRKRTRNKTTSLSDYSSDTTGTEQRFKRDPNE